MKKILALVMISLLLVIGCKTKGENKTDTQLMTIVPFVVLKGQYESSTNPGTYITHYTITETEYQLVTKFKCITVPNQEPMYTIVYALRTIRIINAISCWDDRHTELKTYIYTEEDLHGVEVAYNDRFHLQMQSLPSNHFYIEFSNGEIYTITLPHKEWQEALDYILKKGKGK